MASFTTEGEIRWGRNQPISPFNLRQHQYVFLESTLRQRVVHAIRMRSPGLSYEEIAGSVTLIMDVYKEDEINDLIKDAEGLGNAVKDAISVMTAEPLSKEREKASFVLAKINTILDESNKRYIYYTVLEKPIGGTFKMIPEEQQYETFMGPFEMGYPDEYTVYSTPDDAELRKMEANTKAEAKAEDERKRLAKEAEEAKAKRQINEAAVAAWRQAEEAAEEAKTKRQINEAAVAARRQAEEEAEEAEAKRQRNEAKRQRNEAAVLAARRQAEEAAEARRQRIEEVKNNILTVYYYRVDFNDIKEGEVYYVVENYTSSEFIKVEVTSKTGPHVDCTILSKGPISAHEDGWKKIEQPATAANILKSRKKLGASSVFYKRRGFASWLASSASLLLPSFEFEGGRRLFSSRKRKTTRKHRTTRKH